MAKKDKRTTRFQHKTGLKGRLNTVAAESRDITPYPMNLTGPDSVIGQGLNDLAETMRQEAGNLLFMCTHRGLPIGLTVEVAIEEAWYARLSGQLEEAMKAFPTGEPNMARCTSQISREHFEMACQLNDWMRQHWDWGWERSRGKTWVIAIWFAIWRRMVGVASSVPPRPVVPRIPPTAIKPVNRKEVLP